ncbi:MalY/PatB family protein [Planctobacterium marinum]|uniref:MalY/PatB family protein n=1 Tax=Planctobacterium marinum TaxID=1631968 RepID=UPI001E474F5E|nr:MalY/PatB family protein [Planctobacterium marinum]MCC2607676.1 pyridoxal phosphate-dependent aminotransferase [Planctobacterium marinum]
MHYTLSDFDTIIDRRETYSMKWQKYQGKDILPLWVADTEFKCADEILTAIKQRTDHGLLGYHLPARYEPANEAVCRWLSKQHGWDIQPEWIVWTPGVVPAFNVACQAYCQPGDKVIVQTPNYPPLLAAPGINNLQRVDIPTIVENDRWTIDLNALEEAAKDPACKIFIVCNPGNPAGTVFTQQELSEIARICEQNKVLLISDEIHCDLVLDEQAKHLPAGALPELQNSSVTLMAASKTFNVAGLGTSFAIIPDARLRASFSKAMMGIMPWVTILGLVATETAFTQCDQWYDTLLQYLRKNRQFLFEEINQIDGFNMLLPQATFLAWIDASKLGVDLPQAYVEAKGVGPSPGADFGDKNFIRINFGCPKSYLEQAVQRLKR